jgi:hypothetical protein
MGWVSGSCTLRGFVCSWPLPGGRNDLGERNCAVSNARWHAKRRGMPPAFVAADEALGYAVRMRARAARRFSARRSSSLRPPQTP